MKKTPSLSGIPNFRTYVRAKAGTNSIVLVVKIAPTEEANPVKSLLVSVQKQGIRNPLRTITVPANEGNIFIRLKDKVSGDVLVRGKVLS